MNSNNGEDIDECCTDLLAMALVVVKSALAMMVSLSATRGGATECQGYI